MSNEQEIAAIAKTLAKAGLLSESYNKAAARVLVKTGYRKADASFERYLLDKILHSAEDYCAYCVRGQSEEPYDENGGDCCNGIREFFEKFVEGK